MPVVLKCFQRQIFALWQLLLPIIHRNILNQEKIKKNEDTIKLNLVKTRDILRDLGKLKNENQLLVGFALETNNEIDNAKVKLHTKNLDFIVLNSLKNEGSGFGFDTNKVSVISKDNTISEFELKTKVEVAADLFDLIQKEII